MRINKYFILLFLTTLLIGCANKNPTQTELVVEYYDALNTSNFEKLTKVITDSITIIEGDYVVNYSWESFHEQFRWDSIFMPTYEVVGLDTDSDQIIATVTSSSRRYEFLKNNPLTCSFRISFSSNKITKLEALDCSDADWNVWQKERDSLVNWTSRNHPELDGFIHDLTMNGSLNYLKAIELYENREDKE